MTTSTSAYCARCGRSLGAAEAVWCGSCGKPHHPECWQAAGKCADGACPGTQLGRPPTLAPAAAAMTPPPQVVTGSQYGAPPSNQSQYDQAIYRDGDRILVIRDGTVLPPLCMRTGDRQDLTRKKRTLQWAPSWVALLILVGVLIYAIVYICISKKVKIEFYLTRAEATRQLWLTILCWVSFVVLFFGSFFLFSLDDIGWLGLVAILGSIAAPLIIYYTAVNMYTVTKIENGYAWMRFRTKEMADALYGAAMITTPR